jgi:hypothetical protein
MTNGEASDFDFGDLESPPPPEVSANDGERVAAMVTRLGRAKALIEQKEAELSKAKAELAEIEEKLLPRMLDEMRCEEFKVPGGPKVQVKKDITANLSVKDPQRRAAGIAWLKANGQAALVRLKAEVDFQQGDMETRDSFEKLFKLWTRREMVDLEIKEDVNHNQLGAAVREMAADGVDFPRELLGYHERRVAKIVKPRGG